MDWRASDEKLRYIVHSSRSKDDELANRDGFDCGFLVPVSLNPKIRDGKFGRYWAGIVLNIGPSTGSHILFLSVHFIHKCSEGADVADFC